MGAPPPSAFPGTWRKGRNVPQKGRGTGLQKGGQIPSFPPPPKKKNSHKAYWTEDGQDERGRFFLEFRAACCGCPNWPLSCGPRLRMIHLSPFDLQIFKRISKQKDAGREHSLFSEPLTKEDNRSGVERGYRKR